MAEPLSDRGRPHVGLLPSRLDRVAGRFAPAWPADPLRTQGAGTGRRLLRPLLAVLVLAVATQSALHLLNWALMDLRIDRLHADVDGSLVGWTGTVMTWTAALAAGLLALLGRGTRTPMLVLAAACAFLSLDDMVRLHEILAPLLRQFGVQGHTGRLWPFVYLPLLCGVGWLLLRTARSVELVTGRRIVAGLCCLVTAVVLEAALVPLLFARGSDVASGPYALEVTVEEALELTGWGLIAFGLLAAAVDLLLDRGAQQARAATSEPDLSMTAGHRTFAPSKDRRVGERRGRAAFLRADDENADRLRAPS